MDQRQHLLQHRDITKSKLGSCLGTLFLLTSIAGIFILPLNYFFSLFEKKYNEIGPALANTFSYQRISDHCQLLNSTDCGNISLKAKMYTNDYEDTHVNWKGGTAAVNFATLSFFVSSISFLLFAYSLFKYSDAHNKIEAPLNEGQMPKYRRQIRNQRIRFALLTLLSAGLYVAVVPLVINPAIVNAAIHKSACEFLPSCIDPMFNQPLFLPNYAGNSNSTEPLCQHPMNESAFVDGTNICTGAPLSPFLGSIFTTPAGTVTCLALTAVFFLAMVFKLTREDDQKNEPLTEHVLHGSGL